MPPGARSVTHFHHFTGAGAHVGATVVIDVIFTRLVGAALMNNPLMMTVWSLCAGRLNSETPMSLNSFLPAGATGGMSLAAGAFAPLGTGSVALASIQVFGVVSFRQPVTLTISTFAGAGAACAAARPRMNAKVVMPV